MRSTRPYPSSTKVERCAAFVRQLSLNPSVNKLRTESTRHGSQRVFTLVMKIAILITATVGEARSAETTAPRNVIMIVVDDLGWADLGCYGSSYFRTPHLDQLATEGLQFTNAYAAAPVCSPTRAAILTGKSPARLDMTIWHEGAVGDGPQDRPLLQAISQPNLSLHEFTIAEMFRQQGYRTAHIGKWHLGTAAYYPENQGFEYSIGGTFWGAPSTFFYPFAGQWSARNKSLRYVPDLAPGKPGDYLPDRLTDKAIEVLKDVKDDPFFLSLWYYTVHSPIEAPSDLVESNRRRTPSAHQKDPTYAAMVERMDHNVGRVLQTLDEYGLSENTVVIMTSDNGGVDFPVRGILPTSNHPLRSGKGTLYEGGIRVPLIVRWPGRTQANTKSHAPVISQDFLPTFAEAFDLEMANPDTLDGVSLLEHFSEFAKPIAARNLYWHFPHYYTRNTPCSAIRHEQWKLLYFYETGEVELYDLKRDLGERRDQSATAAERAEHLLAELQRWHGKIGANAPVINPNYDATPEPAK